MMTPYNDFLSLMFIVVCGTGFSAYFFYLIQKNKNQTEKKINTIEFKNNEIIVSVDKIADKIEKIANKVESQGQQLSVCVTALSKNVTMLKYKNIIDTKLKQLLRNTKVDALRLYLQVKSEIMVSRFMELCQTGVKNVNANILQNRFELSRNELWHAAERYFKKDFPNFNETTTQERKAELEKFVNELLYIAKDTETNHLEKRFLEVCTDYILRQLEYTYNDFQIYLANNKQTIPTINIKDELKHLLSENKLQIVIKELKDFFKSNNNTKDYDLLIQLKRQYAELEKKEIDRSLSESEIKTEKSRISASLMILINSLHENNA